MSRVGPFGLEVASLKRLRFSDGIFHRCASPELIVTENFNYAEEAAKRGIYLIFLCIKDHISLKKYPYLSKAIQIHISLNELNII